MKQRKTLTEQRNIIDCKGRSHLQLRTNLKAGSDVYTVTIPQTPGGTEGPAPVMSVTFPAS